MFHVLIIEDSPANLALAATFLSLAGYEPLKATNAVDGIHMAREQHPNLILMDLAMPDMDGLAATRILRGDPATSDIPIIAVTGYAMAGDQERALSAGCDGYLTKPFARHALLAEVESVLGKRTNKSAAS